jgi:hypothetical protein
MVTDVATFVLDHWPFRRSAVTLRARRRASEHSPSVEPITGTACESHAGL